MLEDKYGKLIKLKTFNDTVLNENRNEQHVKQIADITDEEGLRWAHASQNGLYQHYNQLYICIYIYISGTKDFPQYNIDGLTLPFDSI